MRNAVYCGGVGHDLFGLVSFVSGGWFCFGLLVLFIIIINVISIKIFLLGNTFDPIFSPVSIFFRTVTPQNN